jgi:hypothetical protein
LNAEPYIEPKKEVICVPRQEADVSPPKIAKRLGGVDFPKSRADLMEYAKRRGASPDILRTLEKLPDKTYRSMADVISGIGKVE